jgi:hypothetical protein
MLIRCKKDIFDSVLLFVPVAARTAQVDRVREWFRNYKLGDEKPPNQFGLNEKAMGASFAKKVRVHMHMCFVCIG